MMKVEHWNTTFIYLKCVIAQEMGKADNPKVIIFLDETSWSTKNEEAGFLSSFGYFYNIFCQVHKKKIVIIDNYDTLWVDNKLRKYIDYFIKGWIK